MIDTQSGIAARSTFSTCGRNVSHFTYLSRCHANFVLEANQRASANNLKKVARKNVRTLNCRAESSRLRLERSESSNAVMYLISHSRAFGSAYALYSSMMFGR